MPFLMEKKEKSLFPLINSFHSMNRLMKSGKRLKLRMFSISSRKLSRIASTSKITSKLVAFLNSSTLKINRILTNMNLICGQVILAL